MRSYQLDAADNKVTVVEESQDQASQTTGHKKMTSMSNDEFTSQSSVEIQANYYLSNAKNILESPQVSNCEKAFHVTQYSTAFQCTC